jgi:hypothetical protein
MAVEEVALLGGEPEALRDGEAVVGEVEPAAVGEDVAEVGVEVHEALSVQEVGELHELLLHQRARGLGAVRAQPGVEPVVQGVRDVLQEQGEARGGRAQRLDVVADLACAPVRDRRVHVRQFVGEGTWRVGQHTPVTHEREARTAPGQHPVGRHLVHGQLPPGAEAGAADGSDAVVAERRHPEEVRGGADVVREQFTIGERHLLHEDAGAVHLHQHAPAADTGRGGCPRGHEVREAAVAQEGEGGGGVGMGGETRAGGHDSMTARQLAA